MSRVQGAFETRAGRWGWSAAVAAVVAAGAWARCRGFPNVFPATGEVELVPSDSHYYVRFALLQLRSFPRFTSLDPFVNFPEVARILWPPLHALVVAAFVALSRGQSEAGAAWVGPFVACAELLGVTLLARRVLGAKPALGMAFLLALIPIGVESGALGNADHHVHEAFLVTAASLGFGHCLFTRSPRAAVLAGMLLGAGRLFTPIEFALLPCLALAFPLAALIDRTAQDLPRLSVLAGVGCAASLLVATLLFGLPGSLAYEYLSMFHPIFSLAVFLGVAGVAGAIVRAPRWPWALAAAAACSAVLVPQLLRAASHLGRADPLLAAIMESEPLVRDPAWALRLFGIVLVALPVCVAVGARRAMRERELRILPALTAAVLLVGAAALQARFSQALTGAAAIVIATSLPRLRHPGWRVVVGLGAATLGVGLLPAPPQAPPPDVALVRPTLRWMREHTPPASPDPFGPERPTYGVVASHQLGNLLTLWAERPAVATMFSQAEVHVAGNARAAAVLAAVNDDEAFALARQTGARYVLVTPSEVVLGHPELDRTRSLLARLLDHAGMADGANAATAHFRLVHDSPEERRRKAKGSYARLFQVVPGALLVGHAAPGEEVHARLRLITNRGMPLEYSRTAKADAQGAFELRVAYATEPGEAVSLASGESGYELSIGAQRKTVQVPEAAVLQGLPVEVGP